MKRRFLAAAVALAPLLIVTAEHAQAATEISTSTTTPVATATASNGTPSDVDIASGGSINPTAAGAAVTLNSNNTVSSEGSISFSNVDNATGILVEGGHTGSVDNAGSITISETYTAPVNPNTGIAYGNWASGGNRYGIAVGGSGIFTGGITNSSTIDIVGNNSYGIFVTAPITGSLTNYVVTPASGSTVASIATGSITVTGNNSAGLYVGSTGGVGGNVEVTTISANGIGARGAVIDGNVGGTVNVSSSVISTGYRSTTRPTAPVISTQYTPDQFEQSGSAVTVGASVDHGLIISAPPFPLSTTNLDQDGNGVPDSIQGTGQVSTYGSAPAIVIASTKQSITLGEVGTGSSAYGFVIEGAVTANGLFDPLLTPALLQAGGVVSATAVQIGGVAGGGETTLVGGLHSTGSISATAYQADATAIHIGAGANISAIVNDGAVVANSSQVNSATTPTVVTIGNGPATVSVPAPSPVNVYGIKIDQGADVSSISNSRSITAFISGTGGAGGNAVAIEDDSGTVTNVNNTGSIIGELTQTYVATPMPGNASAIDLRQGTTAQSITQSIAPVPTGAAGFNLNTAYAVGAIVSEVDTATTSLGVTTNANNYYVAVIATTAGQDPVNNPTLWRQIGTSTPSILGSIYFGNGGSTLTVNGGTVIGGVIDLGSGVNTLTVNGPLAQTLNNVEVGGNVVDGAAVESNVVLAGTSVIGYIKDEGVNTLTVNVQSGLLSDLNPNTIQARSVAVGASGTLLVAEDPANSGNHPIFVTTGASTFAPGAQVGLNLLSVQFAQSATYAVVEAAGQGTISAGAFNTSAANNAPYLYTATPSYVAANPATGAPAQVDLTVTRRTPAQLGFNAAEGSALNAVLAAVPANNGIEQAILSQTTEAGLKSVYDQLLPDQGQGIFESLDAAAEAISSFTGTTPDAGTRVPGTSLWLQEVNERVQRDGVSTLGSDSQLIGIVAGWEHAGVNGGALGFTVSYLNAQEVDDAAAVGAHVVGSMVEGGVYYRRATGPLTMSVRGAVGYSWFGDQRRFITADAFDSASSSWGGVFYDGHAGAAYEFDFGRYFARPEISADYLRLQEGAHTDTGGGPGFDLTVDSRTSTRFSGDAVVAIGEQWGKTSWIRAEIRGGYREIFEGEDGATTANFTGGDPFTLASDPDKGGWFTVGFSLKSGTPFSYVALEGDADMRAGEQRYDLRIAGRSLF